MTSPEILFTICSDGYDHVVVSMFIQTHFLNCYHGNIQSITNDFIYLALYIQLYYGGGSLLYLQCGEVNFLYGFINVYNSYFKFFIFIVLLCEIDLHCFLI